MRTGAVLVPLMFLCCTASAVSAQNLAIGKALFDSHCSSCHGQPPRLTSNAGRAANNVSFLRSSIRGTRDMTYLTFLSDTDLADIAAYLGNYAAVPSNSTTANERLFNWAEWKYQTLLTPRATTQAISQYAVRFYSGSGLYVGVSGDAVYLYDQNNVAGGVVNLGALSSFLNSAANDGF